MPVEMVTIPNVELAAVGTWPTAQGNGRMTLEDLQSMAEHATDPRVGFRPRVKIGHGNTGPGAAPAWGRVENVRVEGDKLLGDLTHVPKKLAEIRPIAFPGVSVEFVRNRRTEDGRTVKAALKAAALLGTEEPAVAAIADASTVDDLHRVMVGEDELVVHAAATLAGMTVEEFVTVGDSAGDEQHATEDEIVPDENPTPSETPGETPAVQPSETPAAPTTTPAAPAAPSGDPAPSETPAPTESVAGLPEGVIPVDKAVWEDTQKRLKALEEQAEEQVAASRDTYLDDAINAGKFAPAQRDTYADLLERAPDTTRALIDAMPEQQVPVHAERGHAGSPDEASSDEFDRFYNDYTARVDRVGSEA